MTRSDQGELNELALFAGTGGGILGGKLLGWRTVCAVERDAYAAAVLAQRQNDGLLKAFPIWSDVTTFDGRPWRGIAQIVSGGFPCQDISSAGKGAGITGERSGLWKEFARIIGEVRPRFVFVENSPMLTFRGLGVVLGDLSAMGFDARWGIISAASVGAPHLRERIWIRAKQRDILSHAEHNGVGWRQQQQGSTEETNDGGASEQPENVADTNSPQRQGRSISSGVRAQHANLSGTSWWGTEPNVGRVANGVAARVDRLKAIGNGQVPIVAATAFRILSGAAVK